MTDAVVAPIVQESYKGLVAATSQHFGYLIHYNRNIKNLNEQVEKLERRINDNRRLIEAAKNNNEEIRDVVEDWMKRADGIVSEAKTIVEDANANKMCFFGWCRDLISCYRLSRKANKKVNSVTQLEEEESKLQDISIGAPPPGIETFLSSGDFVNFETTRSAMEKVMRALKEDETNFIGIHGMGGAGKTTMVKEIAIKAKKEKLFDEVIFAVVSQTVELKKIQAQLAEQLGLRFNEDTELARAGQLYVRLKNEKRILVILDDVWDRLDVTAIRIPMGVDHEGCKLIITTRREEVCSTMGLGSETTKIIHLGVLSEQESWDLFRRKAGVVIGSPTLAVAQEVAAECGRLPIALVTVGRAMRDVKDVKKWKEAAKVLKKSMPTKIEGVEKEVFNSIKLSYDYLRDEEAKACFLLCSLFPEDHNISIEDLARYGMGLRIFENVETVNEARDRTDAIINNLKSSCLLMLAGNREGKVKMHDVVRDVAISIGSKMYLVRTGKNVKEWPNLETLKDYTGISLMHNQITEHPDALECPNLQILLLQNHTHQIPGVFKGMEALKVLDGSILPYNNDLNYREFEPSFRYLTKIRTLILEGWRFGDITALGEIKTLEILSFARCRFQEPLNALRHLTNLRLLDLRFCRIGSSTISSIVPEDVISRLSRLEELYMEGASARWASEGRNYPQNLPRIVELGSLHHLKFLTMHIDGLECIPENFVFPESEIFRITIGPDDENPRRNNYFFHEAVNRFENYLTINGGGRQQKELLPIRSLNFVGHSLNILKTLEVRGCDELESLSQRLAFYDLEKLSLHNLQFVKIRDCDGLKTLFLPAIARTLKKLEALEVSGCAKLEEIVAKEQDGQEEEEAAANRIVFPQLKKLNLRSLNNLDGFCRGCFSFEWPSLERVELEYCPKLITFTAAVAIDGTQSTLKQKGSEVEFYPNSSISFAPLELLQNLQELHISFCKALEIIFDLEHKGPLVEKKEFLANLKVLNLLVLRELKHLWTGPTSQVILHNLQKVDIFGCNKLKNLFLPTIARTLEKLEYLDVSCCGELEEIVAKEQEGHEEGEAAIYKIVFPQLKTLHLYRLYNLNGFCIGSFPFEWPSLELVTVKRCPKMKTFTAAVPADRIQSTPKLNTIKLDDVEIDVVDINSAIQKHFKEKNLQELSIEDCEALANLKVLRLEYYHELKHIWKGPTAQVILHNLQEVRIVECNKLKSLFLPTIARTLEKLEYLEVNQCDELEEIVAKEQEGHEEGEAAIHKIVFPQLKTLLLSWLPNLNGFCIGSFPFEWPSLELVEVKWCPKIKTFTAAVPADGIQSTPKLNKIKLGGVDVHELKHFWKGPTAQVILHNLREVTISRCNKLKSLFLPTIARTLEKLEYLEVNECDELEEIVAKEQEGHEEGEAAIHKIVFPQLKTLSLKWLSNLNGFCIGSFPFEWPSLELVKVNYCPKMKTFTAAVPADGIQSTPKLNTIELDYKNIDVVDINSAIQKHFKGKIASRMEQSDESDEPQNDESDGSQNDEWDGSQNDEWDGSQGDESDNPQSSTQ